MTIVSIKLCVLLVLSFFPTLTTQVATKAAVPPSPILYFVGSEPYKSGGKEFIKYRYKVFNKEAFPRELFLAAPELPPCGTNTNSSRTWLDVYAQNGKRLYGFCGMRSPNDLDNIWFAMDANSIPPSWIYIEMIDRKTTTKYKSNLAETTN